MKPVCIIPETHDGFTLTENKLSWHETFYPPKSRKIITYVGLLRFDNKIFGI